MKHTIKESAMPGMFSDSNRYSTDKGEISLLHPCEGTFGNYEIFCISGDLFEDIMRFETLDEAMDKIKSFLE